MVFSEAEPGLVIMFSRPNPVGLLQVSQLSKFFDSQPEQLQLYQTSEFTPLRIPSKFLPSENSGQLVQSE